MKQKTQVDLLHGPIMKSLIIFMIPIMISNIFQQLYNAVDTAIVGNFLGEN
jgi:Na+-driven multidrug efflux pump